MKALRIILIVLLVLYGVGPLFGGIMTLVDQAKQADLLKLGEMSPGIEKLLLMSAALMLAQVWIYFSAIALLVRKLKEGYMYAVTLGFMKLIEALVIVIAFNAHNFGSASDYIAIIEGLLLVVLAIIAFKKQQASSQK